MPPPGVGTTTGTLYQNPGFFTYARQAGQGAYYSAPGVQSAHPPGWNVAGVDYAVGIPARTVLKDPATSTPAGCSYNPTGWGGKTPRMDCSGPNLVLDSLDFSLHGGVFINIANCTGTLTITRDKFGPAPSGTVMLVAPSCTADVKFARDYFDGGAPSTNYADPFSIRTSGSLEVKYSVFLHTEGRPFVTNPNPGVVGNLTLKFNYVEGFIYGSDGAHGEVVAASYQNNTVPLTTYSFNTVLQPANVGHSPGSSSTIYVASGLGGNTFNSIDVDHNVTVTNLNGQYVTTEVSAADFGAGGSAPNTVVKATIVGNYTDPNGSYGCVNADGGSAPKSATFTGNVDMFDGSPLTGLDFPSRPCAGHH